MTLQQLRSIQEVVRHGLNISAAARALGNTPPNVSRYIRLLEEELAVRMFQRVGGKLTGLTPEGISIMLEVGAVLAGVDGLHRLAQDMQHVADGRLTVGCADVCAAQVLPPALTEFKRHYPGVVVNILHGSPQEMIRLLGDGVVDFALVAGDMPQYGELLLLPYMRHNLSIVVASGHPLSQLESISLTDLAAYPLATYAAGHVGRANVDAAFAAANVVPDIAYTSNDAELLQNMIHGGDVVGVFCVSAYSQGTAANLLTREGERLFAPVAVYVCLRRDGVMRRHGYALIEQLAPHLSYDKVAQACTMRDFGPVLDVAGDTPRPVIGQSMDNVTSLPRAAALASRYELDFACRSIANY